MNTTENLSIVAMTDDGRLLKTEHKITRKPPLCFGTNFQKVQEFMRVMEQPGPGTPSFPSEGIQKLRIALIQEELNEFCDGIAKQDIVEVADAIADMLYVVYGAAEAFGLDADAIFNEVHESNMTKLGPDGKVVKNAAGKVQKSKDYRPPNLHPILFPSQS